METLVVYPENASQFSLLKGLLAEMKIKFTEEKKAAKIEKIDISFLSEKDFLKKIDDSIRQAEQGKMRRISKEKQREFLGL